MVFRDSRLKIDRAKKHIADIEGRIGGLPDAYTARIQLDTAARCRVVKYSLNDKRVLTDISLMVGDAVHNLKCALDYTWCETVKQLVPTAERRFAKFPVYETKEKLEIALAGAKIDGSANVGLFKFITGEIKPYSGGNYAVWSVHRLDIRDKHRLLLPVFALASIDGLEVEDDERKLIKINTYSTSDPPPYYVPISHGLYIKNKGQVAAEIILQNGEFADPIHIPDTLSFYAAYVLQTVEVFERFLETQG